MTFFQATKTCLQKYFVRSGRASRSEFWWFILATYIAVMFAGILDAVVFGPDLTVVLFGSLIVLLIAIPSFTASVRRLHDTGRSAWFLLLPLAGFGCGITFGAVFGPTLGMVASFITGLIMLAGFLLPFWWQTRPSDPNPNKYGPNPHEVLS